MAATALTFQSLILQISPWWLRSGLGGKLLSAIGVTVDGMSDAALAGIRIRFPDTTQPDALALLGRDRKILRGSAETDAVYATRLQPWLDDHRTRGNPYAMLSQIHAYFASAPFLIELIYQSGRRYSMATDGTVTRDDVNFGDNNVAKWARWTLIYHWPVAINTFGKWGAHGTTTWGSQGNLWGVDPADLNATQSRDLTLVPTAWNAAHAQGVIVLLGPGARVWGYPTREWNTGNGKWGAGGRVVRLPIGI
jgi:hypothetical protein